MLCKKKLKKNKKKIRISSFTNKRKVVSVALSSLFHVTGM